MGLLDDAIREHLDLKRRRGADPAEVERAEREALGPVRRGPEEPEPAPPADTAAAFDQHAETEWGEPEGFTESPGDELISTGVVEPEAGAPDVGAGPPTELHDPFADEPDPFETQQHEPQHYESERYEPESPPAGPSEPEPLALEQQPRRRGFLGRRKQRDAPPEPEHYDDQFDHDDDPFAEPPQAAAPPPPRPAAGPPPAQTGKGGEAGGETVEYEVEAAFEAEHHAEGDDLLEETPEFLEDTPDHDRLWFEQRPPKDFDFDG